MQCLTSTCTEDRINTMKNLMHKTEERQEAGNVLHIKPNDGRNTLHFEVQRNTRANVFRDRTKYTRKKKHKKLLPPKKL